MSKQVLEITDLKSNMFMPVIQVRDVARARILPLAEKKRMGVSDRDVVISSQVYGDSLITRKEFIQHYTEMNQRAIKLRGWKTDRGYNVIGVGSNQAFAMAIPSNYSFKYKGKLVKSGGVYLVCRPNKDGEPDVANARLIRRKDFVKMFTMPLNDTLKKYSKINKPVSHVVKPKEPLVREVNPMVVSKTEPVGNVGKLILIAKIYDVEKRPIGYRAQAPSGKTKDLTEGMVIQLCRGKKVGNATVVMDEQRGRYFLRGIGMSLSDLPKVILN